jgi:hypothetical protein
MLAVLKGKASGRKPRLFAAACCRRVWPRLSDPRTRGAVEVAERYADGGATDEERRAARSGAGDAYRDFFADRFQYEEYAATSAYRLASAYRLMDEPLDAPWVVQAVARTAESFGAHEAGAQAATLRDILGDPFRPVPVEPAWRSWSDGAVVKLARAAYEERRLPSGELDPARLAVLADALEEAGCTVKEILDHLRGPGPHVRGCWPVDLVLGRE